MRTFATCLIVMLFTITVNSAEDEFVYIENDQIKVGINLSIGGAITHVSKLHGQNMINSSDWGRQIQQSYYSGPENYQKEGKEKSEYWGMFPWNPIQAGDCFNNGAKVLKLEKTDDSLYVKTLPMLWPMKDDPGECYFETWIKLNGNSFNYRARLVNNRSDKTLYHAFDQEIPAIYTNGPWCRLITYSGEKPYTGDAVTEVFEANKPIWPPLSYIPSERWAALVDKSGEGIGVVHPAPIRYIGGFAGKPGKGGPKDSPTGYISPVSREILDHNIRYEYKCDFVVGSIDEIRDFAVKKASGKLSAWNFKKDRQSWYYENGIDTGWPIKNGLKLIPAASATMRLVGPMTLWNAESAPVLAIKAEISDGAGGNATVFWRKLPASAVLTGAEAGEWMNKWWIPERSVKFNMKGTGKQEWYYIDLSANNSYSGNITGVAIDIPAFDANSKIVIHEIKLLKSKK